MFYLKIFIFQIMFWKFNLVDSHLDALLNKEDVTLEDLMEEEDILQECKVQNKKLIEFLIKPDVMTKMVNLIIQEPPDDMDETSKYKYADIACELLTADVNDINDYFMENHELLDKLYSFLQPNEENTSSTESSVNKECLKQLNPLLASFFSKTLSILLTKRTEKMIDYLKGKDNFITLLVEHIGTSAIMDLWIKLVLCTDNAFLRTRILEWLNEQNAIKQLVESINSSADEDKHNNASQTLCDIVRASREQLSHLQENAVPDPLLESIESTDMVLNLLDHMFSGERKDSVIVSGIAVILSLLEFKKPVSNIQIPAMPTDDNEQKMPITASVLEHDPNALTELDIERLEKGVNQTLDALKTRLEDICSLLSSPQQRDPVHTTAGILDPPFGQTRLQVAKLVLNLIRANDHSINVQLAKLGIFAVLIDLFFKYSLNNFLHTQVEQCIDAILANEPTKDNIETENQHVLLKQLFEELRIVQKILEAWELNKSDGLKPGGQRKGYMGHLTKIANHIVHNMENGLNTELMHQIKNLPDDYAQQWEVFVSGSLSEINKKNTIVPVSIVNPPSSTEDETTNYIDMSFPHETALQQAFSDYQMQQMTSNFNDQFGFHEDEFSDQGGISIPIEITNVNFNMSANDDSKCSDMFEEACRQRIHAFDDSESSDEDVWTDKVHSSSEIKRNRCSSDKSDESTDSDEEHTTTLSERSQNAADFSTPGLTSSSSDEVKMDIDVNDGWTANFNSVPMEDSTIAMETQNLWDNPSSQASDSRNQTDWANFATFESDFSCQDPFSSNTSESTQKSSFSAMETTEPSETVVKAGEMTIDSNGAIEEKTEECVNSKSDIWGEATFSSSSSSTTTPTTVSSFTDNFSFSSEAIKTNSSPAVESEDVYTEKQDIKVNQSSNSTIILQSSVQISKDSS
ncbi:Serine/threonine-protein phosphatase 6 regulatory subunit 3 [Nymphon striatum]|nr:Serine/threonine-protein phosphatase 6 regulatory subunit 3 [Nymphon striatum]